jgi:hypothetical protein
MHDGDRMCTRTCSPPPAHESAYIRHEVVVKRASAVRGRTGSDRPRQTERGGGCGRNGGRTAEAVADAAEADFGPAEAVAEKRADGPPGVADARADGPRRRLRTKGRTDRAGGCGRNGRAAAAPRTKEAASARSGAAHVSRSRPPHTARSPARP